VTPRAWWRAHRQLAGEVARLTEQVAGWRTTALRRAGMVESFADERNLAVDRMRTAETLLVQLHLGADLGDAPREAGRINLHATARAIGQALAAANRAVRTSGTPAALPARPAPAAREQADATAELPRVLQPLVRGFRMAPVIAGVTRWDLSRAVPGEQLPREVGYARSLMRVQAELEQMVAVRSDLAGWAHRIAAAAEVPVGFTRDEVRT
jgi:hypothetical protein